MSKYPNLLDCFPDVKLEVSDDSVYDIKIHKKVIDMNIKTMSLKCVVELSPKGTFVKVFSDYGFKNNLKPLSCLIYVYDEHVFKMYGECDTYVTLEVSYILERIIESCIKK